MTEDSLLTKTVSLGERREHLLHKDGGCGKSVSPKRFLSLDSVLKNEFGAKVVKIPLNAGFSCPNRDGAKGFGGCIYCSSSLSGEFAGSPSLSLKEQFDIGKAEYLKKWGDTLYMAYLQAGTNTYAPYEKLVRVFVRLFQFRIQWG